MKPISIAMSLVFILLVGCGGKSSSAPAAGTTAVSGVAATNGSQFGNATFGSAKF